jgi:hypothetical protein
MTVDSQERLGDPAKARAREHIVLHDEADVRTAGGRRSPTPRVPCARYRARTAAAREAGPRRGACQLLGERAGTLAAERVEHHHDVDRRSHVGVPRMTRLTSAASRPVSSRVSTRTSGYVSAHQPLRAASTRVASP